MFLILIFNISICFSQQAKVKNIEISIYHSLSFSYSKFEIKEDIIKSPSKFNVGGFGLKCQIPILKKYKNINLTTHIGGMDLSTSAQFQYRLPLDSIKSSTGAIAIKAKKTYIERYTYYSIGLKKIINNDKKLKLNFETGIRLLVNVNATRDTNSLAEYQVGNALIYRNITFIHSRKFTIVPYLAIGFDFKLNKYKFGFQLWVQKGFQKLTEYNYKLSYPSSNQPVFDYNSNFYSKGLAWGNNFYIVLKTF